MSSLVDVKITDFGLAGRLVERKKQVNPQESMLEPIDSSCNENEHLTRDEESVSSEDTAIEDSSDDDMEGDLRRVRRRTLCGTAGFRPPEQVGQRYVDYFSRSGYDEKADFFSLGVTVFTMVAGKRPFPSKKEIVLSATGMSSPSPSRRRSSITGTSLERATMRKALRDVEFVSSAC